MQKICRLDLRGCVLFALVGATAAVSVASPAFGQVTQEAKEADQIEAHDQAALAKTAQNPLATIVTFPFQFNFNNGVGPFDRRQTTLNIQPVIPFPAGDMTIISRLILPYVSIPVGETDAVTGFADWSWSLFFSPMPKGNLSWGVGPAFSLPFATNPEALGSGKLSLGPTAVLFWVLGARQLDARSRREQHLVHCRRQRPRIRQQVLRAVVDQLQLRRRLGVRNCTDHHVRLEGAVR
jgi:hypothetical protein